MGVGPVWTGAENLALTANFFVFSCALYFIRTCFCVLIVLHFAFLSLRATHKHKTSMPPAEFEPAIRASDRPQTLVFDSRATGIGRIRSPDHPAHIKSLYRLSYRGPRENNEKRLKRASLAVHCV